MENRYLLQMFTFTESLAYYLNAIEANGSVLAKLRTMAERLHLRPDQVATLDDLILENTKCARQCQIYSSVLSGLMDARGTIVNNNMNVLLKNLTLINIIFLPLNLLASIGGMSEFSMMTQGTDWRLAYALFSLGMVVLGWITYTFVLPATERNSLPQRKPGINTLSQNRHHAIWFVTGVRAYLHPLVSPRGIQILGALKARSKRRPSKLFAANMLMR